VPIGRTDNPHHASKLRALISDHLRNTGELAHLMREQGGEPRRPQTDVLVNSADLQHIARSAAILVRRTGCSPREAALGGPLRNRAFLASIYLIHKSSLRPELDREG
jgi:hypothetical protein